MQTNNSQRIIKVGTQQVEVNYKGYLINFYDWNKDVARTMAKEDEIELSDFHWITFDYLRKFYDKYQVPPSPRVIIKSVGDKGNIFGGTSRTLRHTFPKGGYKQACRLAGLPTHRTFAC
ncbi:MAG: TusE/DsrC/DsvC family sulfur relay protein [gamma proteobacterium symbiont of Bathyaustriella thionipta]|nr:TusE/DsrC/DsvC family sulfur relay protein [gamma proteobacterium symbiont of Bathyaustriella thionipta]MCU7958164.1 TusE/DsrC/DsvC family sulfur relay protein [gamma proteobacterium symbiont of Bathyaustriella thionipta]MCU7966429.1 TusE/DsrC/DsvC family sulfur relay protein [gamma proteobacterium symbiont of Bathyaustriella thionipta]